MDIPDFLDAVDHPEVAAAYRFFAERYPENALGVYTRHDWERLRDAYQIVDGLSVLDVGVGNGAFLHILRSSGEFMRIHGIDIRKHSMLHLPEDVEFQTMSVTDMRTFSDDEFDTVVCQEVLEHLEIVDFARGLDELRRVAQNRIIVTVPFDEPEPVWWYDRPGGHRQSFDQPKLERTFPNAMAAKLPRHGVPWLLLVEDERLQVEALRIVAYEELLETLARVH